jgi:hypothetical protein
VIATTRQTHTGKILHQPGKFPIPLPIAKRRIGFPNSKRVPFFGAPYLQSNRSGHFLAAYQLQSGHQTLQRL